VDQNRLRELTTEMCVLVDAQTKLLDGVISLAGMGGREATAYSRRNERLRELSKQLNSSACSPTTTSSALS
jgi:hypothetical protein